MGLFQPPPLVCLLEAAAAAAFAAACSSSSAFCSSSSKKSTFTLSGLRGGTEGPGLCGPLVLVATCLLLLLPLLLLWLLLPLLTTELPLPPPPTSLISIISTSLGPPLLPKNDAPFHGLRTGERGPGLRGPLVAPPPPASAPAPVPAFPGLCLVVVTRPTGEEEAALGERAGLPRVGLPQTPPPR